MVSLLIHHQLYLILYSMSHYHLRHHPLPLQLLLLIVLVLVSFVILEITIIMYCIVLSQFNFLFLIVPLDSSIMLNYLPNNQKRFLLLALAVGTGSSIGLVCITSALIFIVVPVIYCCQLQNRNNQGTKTVH